MDVMVAVFEINDCVEIVTTNSTFMGHLGTINHVVSNDPLPYTVRFSSGLEMAFAGRELRLIKCQSRLTVI